MGQTTLWAVAILAFVSLSLYGLGAISGMTNRAIRNFSWVSSVRKSTKYSRDQYAYFGLTSVYYSYRNCRPNGAVCDDDESQSRVVKYTECSDDLNYCYSCNRYGLATLILIIISFFIMIIAITFTLLRIFAIDTKFLQLLSSLSSFLSFVASVIGVVVYQKCFYAIESGINHELATLYGSSQIMVMVATALSFFVSVGHLMITPKIKPVYTNPNVNTSMELTRNDV